MSFSPKCTLSDSELWSNFRVGDRECYTLLINRYTGLLYRYGIRFNQNDDFIKDCIQDVFLALWDSRENISQTPSVKSYLFKALRLKIFREQSKWNNEELFSDEHYDFLIEFNIEDRLIEEQQSHETRDKLLQVLNRLPKRQKEVLYLRFYENLDHARIASIMGLNKQSVYNLLHESVSNLRKAWLGEMALLLSLLTRYI